MSRESIPLMDVHKRGEVFSPDIQEVPVIEVIIKEEALDSSDEVGEIKAPHVSHVADSPTEPQPGTSQGSEDFDELYAVPPFSPLSDLEDRECIEMKGKGGPVKRSHPTPYAHPSTSR